MSLFGVKALRVMEDFANANAAKGLLTGMVEAVDPVLQKLGITILLVNEYYPKAVLPGETSLRMHQNHDMGRQIDICLRKPGQADHFRPKEELVLDFCTAVAYCKQSEPNDAHIAVTLQLLGKFGDGSNKAGGRSASTMPKTPPNERATGKTDKNEEKKMSPAGRAALAREQLAKEKAEAERRKKSAAFQSKPASKVKKEDSEFIIIDD